MKKVSQSGLLLLLSGAVLINYLDRGALSIAAPLLSREMSLSSIQLGLLFSAFFWSYSIFQLAAGWLVDRWYVYRIFTGGFILWSVATAITPFVRSFGALFGARLLLGAGESVAYPSYSSIVVGNFAEERRGFANSLLDASSKLGPVLSTAIGALTVDRFGWRALFGGLACVSFAWLLPWILWHRHSENRYTRPVHHGVSFLNIVKRSQLWSTSAGMFALGYVWTFLLSWLPMYLVNQRGYKLQQVASLGSLPFAAMALTTLAAGWLSDHLIASGASVSRVRKMFVNTGLVLCSATILPVPLCPRGAAITLLTVSCAFLGLFTSNVWAITQTLAGSNAAGSWSGIQNAIGNFGGIISPAITGLIIHWTGSYTLAFSMCAAVLLAGVIAYSLIGPIEPLRWEGTDEQEHSPPVVTVIPTQD
jgi:MFS family permease